MKRILSLLLTFVFTIMLIPTNFVFAAGGVQVNSFTINNGDQQTLQANVTLNLDVANCQYVQISNDGTTYTDMQPYATSIAWNITNPLYGGTTAKGQKTVYIKVTGTDGTSTATATANIIYTDATLNVPVVNSLTSPQIIDAEQELQDPSSVYKNEFVYTTNNTINLDIDTDGAWVAVEYYNSGDFTTTPVPIVNKKATITIPDVAGIDMTKFIVYNFDKTLNTTYYYKSTINPGANIMQVRYAPRVTISGTLYVDNAPAPNQQFRFWTNISSEDRTVTTDGSGHYSTDLILQGCTYTKITLNGIERSQLWYQNNATSGPYSKDFYFTSPHPVVWHDAQLEKAVKTAMFVQDDYIVTQEDIANLTSIDASWCTAPIQDYEDIAGATNLSHITIGNTGTNSSKLFDITNAEFKALFDYARSRTNPNMGLTFKLMDQNFDVTGISGINVDSLENQLQGCTNTAAFANLFTVGRTLVLSNEVNLDDYASKMGTLDTLVLGANSLTGSTINLPTSLRTLSALIGTMSSGAKTALENALATNDLPNLNSLTVQYSGGTGNWNANKGLDWDNIVGTTKIKNLPYLTLIGQKVSSINSIKGMLGTVGNLTLNSDGLTDMTGIDTINFAPGASLDLSNNFITDATPLLGIKDNSNITHLSVDHNYMDVYSNTTIQNYISSFVPMVSDFNNVYQYKSFVDQGTTTDFFRMDVGDTKPVLVEDGLLKNGFTENIAQTYYPSATINNVTVSDVLGNNILGYSGNTANITVTANAKGHAKLKLSTLGIDHIMTNTYVDAYIGKANIKGTITDADTSNPISNVTVTLTDKTDNQTYTTTTDSNGKYQFTGFYGGNYSIATSNSQYVDKSVDTFLNPISDDVVDIQLTKKPITSGTITVKYQDENGTDIATPDVHSNIPLGSYNYDPIAITGYTTTDTTKTVNLTALNNNQTVIFNYTSIKGSITIKYQDENSTDITTPDVISNLSLGSYTENAKSFTNYTLNDSNSKTVTLTAANKDQVITFSYKKIKGSITVKYQDENGTDITTPDVISNLDLGTYTENAKSFTNYTLNDSNSKSVTLTAANKDQVIIFSYKKIKGSITIKYQDENSTDIATPDVISNLDLGTYTENAKSFTNYTLNDTSSKSVTLTAANKDQVIIFSYKKIKGSITVKYQDENGTDITTPDVLTSLDLGTYSATAKSFTNYNLVGANTKSVTLTAANKDQVITFNYNKIKGSITIQYQDQNGHDIVTPDVKSNLDLGSYTENAKSFTNYTLNDSPSKSVTLTAANADQVIKFNYNKILGSVTIKYVDENNNLLEAATVVSNLDLGNYVYTAKSFNGFTLNDSLSKSITLTADNKDQTVVFNYKKVVAPVVKGSITIKYVDENNNLLEAATVVSNLTLGTYTQQAKEFSGYVLNDESSKIVTLTADNKDQSITFSYKKIKGSVTIKYVDDNNNLLEPATVKSNLDLGNYTYKAIDFPGYLLNDVNSKSVTLTADSKDQTITFKYSKIKGSVTIVGYDENGNKIYTYTDGGLDLGNYTINAPGVDGWILNDVLSKLVSLSADAKDQIVSFLFRKPVGSITIKYVDDNNKAIISDVTYSKLSLGKHTFNAKSIDGYTLNDDYTKSATLSKDGDSSVITFKYSKIVPEVKTGTVRGYLKNEDGTPIANATIELHSTPRTTTTDANGYFEFKDVEIGDHKLYLADKNLSPDPILLKSVTVKEDDNVKGQIPGSEFRSNNGMVEAAAFSITDKSLDKNLEMIVALNVKGKITVQYMYNGKLITQDVMDNQDMGKHTVKAKDIKGYKLASGQSADKNVELTEANRNVTITFEYAKSFPILPPVVAAFLFAVLVVILRKHIVVYKVEEIDGKEVLTKIRKKRVKITKDTVTVDLTREMRIANGAEVKVVFLKNIARRIGGKEVIFLNNKVEINRYVAPIQMNKKFDVTM